MGMWGTKGEKRAVSDERWLWEPARLTASPVPWLPTSERSEGLATALSLFLFNIYFHVDEATIRNHFTVASHYLFSLLFSLFHFPHSFVEVNSWGSEREKRKGMGRREETNRGKGDEMRWGKVPIHSPLTSQAILTSFHCLWLMVQFGERNS